MNETDLLMLADSALSDSLSGKLDGMSSCEDPYDFLLELSRRRWSCVVLEAPLDGTSQAGRDDFAGLCRASRRLQRDSRIVSFCAPAAEMNVRSLVGRVLDDYYILPPTPEELDAINRGGDARETRPALAGEAAAGQDEKLSPRDFTRLLESVQSVAALEDRIAEELGRRIGAKLSWADAPPEGCEPLLLAAGDGPRVLVRPADKPLSAADAAYIAAIQHVLPGLLEVARRTETLHRLAITDHLTGAYNRRYFYHITDQILLRARQQSIRIMLLLYDIDNFKSYNDNFGHAAGDEILRETAKLMKKVSRGQDIVARIGGDEFAVLFWDADKPRKPGSTPLEAANVLAERFRAAFARHEFPVLGPEAKGTLSISGGLASFPKDGKTCRQLLRSADMALRGAKKSGKNAIRLIGQ